MNFAPPGAEVWGYSEGIRRVWDIRLDFDLARLSEAVGETLTMPEARVFRNDRLRHLARCLCEQRGHVWNEPKDGEALKMS